MSQFQEKSKLTYIRTYEGGSFYKTTPPKSVGPRWDTEFIEHFNFGNRLMDRLTGGPFPLCDWTTYEELSRM